jgi:hypothetical protein
MKFKPSSFSLAGALSVIVWFSVLLLTACTTHITATTQDDPRQAYLRAVADAAIAEPGEISRNLTAISADNAKLIWEGVPGKSRVRVVTWTDYPGYDDQIGQTIEIQRCAWVTVSPQLQIFCRASNLKPADLTLRMEQLLGLPPNDGKDRFVEFWADPQDLFRPSPDPGISDHEAELDFPVSARFVRVSDAHVQWFEKNKSGSYGANGYPWTRLGYTYDWGNPKSEVGLSEFVIRKGAAVSIQALYTIEVFCR